MPIRVGVIGVGSIAQIAHIPNYIKNEQVVLAALADFNQQRVQSVANKFGVAATYTDVEQMLANEKLDAVSICTPNTSHVPLALKAIQYGVDVLLEKPLSTSYQEAMKLVAEAEKANRICMIGMPHRFRNQARALKHLVDSGALGNIYYVKAKILRRRGTPTGWFTDSSKSGGGSLMDIGVHALDLAWWITGMQKPSRISGQLVRGIGRYDTLMTDRWKSADASNQDNSIFDVEDFSTAYIRFENGMVLSLEVSWALNGPQDDAVKVDAYGTKGGISLDPLCYYGEQNQVFIEAKLDVTSNNFYEDEINHFIDCVLHRSTPLIPASQGADVVRMLSGIRLSSELHREVDVEEIEV